MSEMLTFGDIFFYQNDDYVYLAMSDNGIIYAARILSANHSSQMIRARDAAISKDGERRTGEKVVYCFVQLKTDGYSDRVAHLNQSDSQKNQHSMLRTPGQAVCSEDMISLRDEILQGPVPVELKNQVSTLNFE